MGADFARKIAAEGQVDEVWAVARRKDKLDELAHGTKGAPASNKGAAIRPIVADLATEAGQALVRAALEADKPELSLLVLNAGLGRFGSFEDSPKERSLGMIDLNIRALTATAKDALPYLVRGSGLILVASLAGFAPMGNFAVYSATKAYVLALGVSLSAELKDRGIRVTILSPGPVATEFAQVASPTGNGASRFDRGAAASGSVVDRCLRDHRRGRLYSYGRASWKALSLFLKLLPRRFSAGAAMGMTRD
jgi:hypothetical protein